MKLKTLVISCSLAFMAQSVSADSLLDVYQQALANDPQLQAAKANFSAGQEAKNLGLANLLPNASASFTRSESDFDLTSYYPATDTTLSGQRDTTTETKAVNLSQALFNLPAWHGYKRGQSLSSQAEARFKFDQQDLIIRVAEAYFAVLRAEENLTSARAEEKAIERQLEQTIQRFEVGLIPITDVHEARAAYDLAVVARLAEEGSLDIAKEALTVLTGRQPADLWKLSDAFEASVPTPQDPEQWVTWATENNALLQASKFSVDAAKRNADAARAQHLPTLGASFDWSDSETSGDSFDRAVNDLNDGSTLSLRLSVPLFAGGGTSAARRQAYQQYLASLETHKLNQRNTIQLTRSQYINVTTGAAAVKARAQAITSAKSALEATQAGYDVGTRNVVDVLNAQKNLYRTQRDYANARYTFVVNVLKLRLQAGLLSEDDVRTIDQQMAAASSTSITGA